MEDLVEPFADDRRIFDSDISDILELVRRQNPNLDKFKKVSMCSCGFVVDSISDVFKDDITDIIGNINELEKGENGGKYCFKVIKDDFAIVYTSFPFWFKVVFLFYNDEDKIKEQFSDKVFSKVICDPSTYKLGKSSGHYNLSKIDIMAEDAPELNDNIFEEINKDIDSFFENEKFYTENNLAFKRGILLYGPPGNGKSSAIKQILLENPDKVGIIMDHRLIEDSLSKFLSTVTKGRDKIIIIEDIDSISEYERSTFLNFLDGVEGLERSFVIATTNYLSKLDPAIANRPSRFDKTYHFGIPNITTRGKIVKRYFKDLSDEKIKEAAKLSDKFSGAYIKELFIQCGTQKIDILEAIEKIKKRTSDYTDYKEPTYYG
jgi:hypothetical protein